MKPKFRLEYVLENLHYGTVRQRKALLAWVNRPKFLNRRPTPAELVRECRRKHSSLYGLMKVNPKDAAEAYWRQTAQDILRHIKIVRVEIATSKILTRPVVAYIPVSVGQFGRIPEDKYIPAQRVANTPELRTAVLARAHRDFLTWMQRYEKYAEFLQEFSPVIQAYRSLRSEAEVA